VRDSLHLVDGLGPACRLTQGEFSRRTSCGRRDMVDYSFIVSLFAVDRNGQPERKAPLPGLDLNVSPPGDLSR
jgi:hypothetical protein